MGLTVSRQTAKNLTVNRQKRDNFTVNRQKRQLLSAVKRFQGLSNLTISAAHLGLRALKESFQLVPPVSMFPNILNLRFFPLICF